LNIQISPSTYDFPLKKVVNEITERRSKRSNIIFNNFNSLAISNNFRDQYEIQLLFTKLKLIVRIVGANIKYKDQLN